MTTEPTHSHSTENHPNKGTGLVIQGRAVVHDDDLRCTFISSGGPGGQNVNKRATKCVLRVALTTMALTPAQFDRFRALAGSLLTAGDEVIISSDEHRSQERNRAECLDRLGDLVRRAMVPPKVRRATKPSRGSKERRLTAKRVRGEAKKRRSDRHE